MSPSVAISDIVQTVVGSGSQDGHRDAAAGNRRRLIDSNNKRRANPGVCRSRWRVRRLYYSLMLWNLRVLVRLYVN